MQPIVLYEGHFSSKQHQVNMYKHLGPNIWDYIDPALYEFFSYAFKNVRDILIGSRTTAT